MNVPKIIHTRQRKAPLRGARLCYCTAHAVQPCHAYGDNIMQRGSSTFQRVMQLNHAACMPAGMCASVAGARRAWQSRQKQQEDEVRTRRGRWPILAFWLLFWENSYELT